MKNKNPWTKKNPFLSVWQSGANAVAGSIRIRATGATKRQARAAMTKNATQMTDLWSVLLTPSMPRKKKRR